MPWSRPVVADPRDPDEARRVAEEILSRPEYRPPRPSLLERVGRWLGDLLDRIFPDFAVGGGGSGAVNLVGWLLLLVLLAGLIALIVWAVLRRTPRVKAEKSEAEPVRVVVDRSREPDEWRRLAAEHAAAGRWREALRCRYRALVGDLARRGRLDEIPGRTTGEERAQLAQSTPEAEPAFTPATELFDRVWYGDEPAGEAELTAFAALEDDVLTRTARRR
jgi:hypothetical protein